MPGPFEKILIIQTASIGDTILVTPVIESLALAYPGSAIDILIKKGHEDLFSGHPGLRRVIAWDKSAWKYLNLLRIFSRIRREKYDLVLNAQRFISTGLLTAFSGAGTTVGFDKNPLSPLFAHRVPHRFLNGGHHEIDRNLALARPFVGEPVRRIRLYPQKSDADAVAQLVSPPYICMAPASLWYTKQYPEDRWVELIDQTNPRITVCLLGAASDHGKCDRIVKQTRRGNVINLAGKLSLLQTAALMKNAVMNFVNDSAPLHLASAVNARVTAIFCSTVPDFGFGPVADDAVVVQTDEPLTCRPCGLHGRKKCPEGHFLCAVSIKTEDLLKRSHHEK